MSFYYNTTLSADISLYGSELRDAMSTARNRKTLSAVDFRRIQPPHRRTLSAVNPYSRRDWAEIVCREIEKEFVTTDGVSHDRKLLFVTLADINCTTAPGHRLSDADLQKFKDTLRVGLREFSYLGFIEPAFYVNLQNGTNVKIRQCISWHLHALVWGVSVRQLEAHLEAHSLAGRYIPIADGFDGTDVRAVKQSTLPRLMSYMLKVPMLGYRVIVHDRKAANGDWLKNENGEVLRGFDQKKQKLRPGERLTLFCAMKSLRLDEFAIAGGMGAKIMSRIRCSALRWSEHLDQQTLSVVHVD